MRRKEAIINMIEKNIEYEEQPGIHTFSMCRRCNKNGCRSVKCVECWKKDLNDAKEVDDE